MHPGPHGRIARPARAAAGALRRRLQLGLLEEEDADQRGRGAEERHRHPLRPQRHAPRGRRQERRRGRYVGSTLSGKYKTLFFRN